MADPRAVRGGRRTKPTPLPTPTPSAATPASHLDALLAALADDEDELAARWARRLIEGDEASSRAERQRENVTQEMTRSP